MCWTSTQVHKDVLCYLRPYLNKRSKMEKGRREGTLNVLIYTTKCCVFVRGVVCPLFGVVCPLFGVPVPSVYTPHL